MTIPISTAYSRIIEWAAALILIAYPSLMFAVKGGMNGSFLLLLILSIVVLLFRPREMQSVIWDREVTFYLLAMSALPLAIFLSQSYHQHYDGHPYDAATRFLLAVPVFLLLRRVRLDVVALVQYGFPVAAIIGCLMLKDLGGGRSGIATLDLIHFGDFELILGMLSLLSINWTGRDAVLIRSLKILGFVAGIYASIASGSRGGWIALPVFALIFMYFKFGRLSLKAISSMLLVLVMAGFLAYASSQAIHHRADETMSDLMTFQHGNLDTSTGIRLQLYKVAAEVVSENPIFGVGPQGFALEMDVMLKEGKITPMAADLGKGEVHNELLSKTAGMGIFGFVALLLIYLVPLRVFYRAARATSAQVRQAGLLGFGFVCGFMVFGLTVEVLNLTMAAAFYSLTVAVMLAACLNIHHGEQCSSDTL